jgi:hypothetical protein
MVPQAQVKRCWRGPLHTTRIVPSSAFLVQNLCKSTLAKVPVWYVPFDCLSLCTHRLPGNIAEKSSCGGTLQYSTIETLDAWLPQAHHINFFYEEAHSYMIVIGDSFAKPFKMEIAVSTMQKQ